MKSIPWTWNHSKKSGTTQNWTLSSCRPVYGLIFLFQWKQEANEEEVEISCPEDLWFANQVIDNSCASLALLNIILNVPNLDIGEHLSHFKDFTCDFSPPVPPQPSTEAKSSYVVSH